jgi:hypothetical protein
MGRLVPQIKADLGHLQRQVDVHHARNSLREIEPAAPQIDFSAGTRAYARARSGHARFRVVLTM